MNVKIGENIKRLRKERDMTQEQLAAELEVSFQAVSRWELGTTYPDIGLLPVIAGYFDVTVDELLGVDMARQEEKVQEIREHLHKLRNKGKTYEAMMFSREKIKDFPNNPDMLYQLAWSIWDWYSDNVNPTEEKEKYETYAKESIELLKKAMKYDKGDGDITDCCKQTLVFNYVNIGEYGKAEETARSLPEIWTTSTTLLPRATKDNGRALLLYQYNVITFLVQMTFALTGVLNRGDYAVEQRLEIELMTEKVLLTVLGDNPCVYNERLYGWSIAAAWEYTKLKRYDEAMDTLERSLKYAINFEERPDCDKYDVVWLNSVTDDTKASVIKSDEDTLYNDMEKHLHNMCSHDSYYESNSRFKAIREKVAAHRNG